MVLVLNKSKRAFILQSGILAAGEHCQLEEAEAKRLAGMYPQEIELVNLPQAKAEVKPEVKEVKEDKGAQAKAETKEASKEEAKKESKKGSKK